MSNVYVREAHTKDPAEVKAGISSFEEMLTKYMIKIMWRDHTATLSGPVSGSIDIGSDYIEVKIKLGMMAKMAGIDPSRLEGSISKRLKAALNA